MVSLLIALTFGLAQPSSYFRQHFPNPTGANAYEEYLSAVDAVSDPAFDGYLAFINGDWRLEPRKDPLPPGLRTTSSPLQARREFVRRYGAVVDLVRAGNRKPALPYRTLGFDSNMSELIHYRRLARLYDSAAVVALADGRSDEATALLLDVIVFGRKIGQETLIGNLVGIACQTIALGRFASSLGQVSIIDARRIRQICDVILAQPEPLITAILSERDFMLRDAKGLLDYAIVGTIPGHRTGGTPPTILDAERRSLLEFLAKLGPGDRRRFEVLVAERIAIRTEGPMRVLRGPERDWLAYRDEPDPEPQPGVYTVEEAVSAAIGMFSPIYEATIKATVRVRTQLRLLRLHAMIVEFKWEQERLPRSLAEAIPPDDLLDPCTGEPFQVEFSGTGYRLFAKSDGQEIELRLRPRQIPDDGIPPPPGPRAPVALQ